MADVRLGLPKQERLHKRREFLKIYERGDPVHASHLVLYFAENNLPLHRLGITVSRKVGRPVVRNRVKRRLREIFRNNKEVISPHCDLVVNARRSAGESSYAQLEADFLGAVGRWKPGKERS